MSRPMHARPGQSRDATTAIFRDTWTLARLCWLLLSTLIPRRALSRAAGRAPATAPTEAGAREVPAPVIPPSGAGTSPGLPRPGDPPPSGPAARSGPGQRLPDAAPGEVTAPASPGAAARRDTWVTWQDPPGSPQVIWSGKPAWTVVSDWRGDWAIEHGSGTVTRAGHWRGGAGRDTIAMPVADGPPRARYVAAHLAWQDQAAAVIT